MPLESFSLLQNCSRLIHHSNTLYKVKIHYDKETFRGGGELNMSHTDVHNEIEQALRAIIYMTQRKVLLKPIVSNHFHIQTRKSKWDFLSKHKNLVFMKENKTLHVHQYMLELIVKRRIDTIPGQAKKDIACKSQEQAKAIQKKVGQKSVGKENESGPSCSKKDTQHTGDNKTGADNRNSISEKTANDIPQTNGVLRFFRDENGRLCQIRQEQSHQKRNLTMEKNNNKNDQKDTLFSPVVRRSPRLKELPSAENKSSTLNSNKKLKHIAKKSTKYNTVENSSTSESSQSSIESDKQTRRQRRSTDKAKKTEGESTSEESDSEPEPEPKKIKLRRSLRLPNQGQTSVEMSNLAGKENQQSIPVSAESHARKTANRSNNASGSPRNLSASSPRVSTVRPVKRHNSATKRDNSGSAVVSPGTVRSPVSTQHPDFISSSRGQDEEISRVERLRTPQSWSVDRLRTMVNSRRDRHAVEQAEREETTNLQRLFEPTRPRDKSDKSKRRMSWGEWLSSKLF